MWVRYAGQTALMKETSSQMIETCCLLPRQLHGRGKARLSYDGDMDPECLQIVDFVSLRDLFGWMRQRVLVLVSRLGCQISDNVLASTT